jgi:hypothetical protein
MQINRNNYEEFLLQYVDGELSAAAKLAVDCFLDENPDLKAELKLLQEAVLQPEPEITFNKADLFKLESSTTDLLLLLDKELSPANEAAVQAKLALEPAYQAEWTLLQQTQLDAAETVVFADKASLYRKEEKARVIPFKWWQMAAAAMLGLAVLYGGWKYTQTTSNNNNPDGFAVKPAAPAATGSNNQVVNQAVIAQPDTHTNDYNSQAAAQSTPNPATQNITIPTNQPNTNVANDVDVQQKGQENNIAENFPKPSNNLPSPIVSTSSVQETNANQTGMSSETAVKNNPADNIGYTQVAFTEREAPFASFDEDDDAGRNKKTKLRGFLKKVKRTLERNAKVSNSDGDVKVANLSFAVQ